MTTWTAGRILDTTTHLTRIDRLVELARDRIRQKAYFSAAGALGAAVLAKRDAMREFPPIIAGENDEFPFIEFYDFLLYLEDVMSYPRAHAMGHGDHPDVPPLDEIRRQLQEARRRLEDHANRDWMDDCGDRFTEAIEHLDRVIARLGRLDLTDQEDIEEVLRKMDQFLRCVSDEVDLKEAYDLLKFLDRGFEHDASLLLKRPPSPRDIEFVLWALRVEEDSKHELIELIIAAADPAWQHGGPGAGEEDLRPVPDDHASRRDSGAGGGLPAVHLEPGQQLLIVADHDAAITDWPILDAWDAPAAPARKPEQRRKGEKDGDDPHDEPPPVIYGEEIDVEPCNPMFVRGLDRNECNPRLEKIPAVCEGEIVGYIWPGSNWRGNVAGAVAEINRSFQFSANYCIHLKLRQLQIAPAQETRMQRMYRAWYQNLINDIGGEQNIGTATIQRRHIDLFITLMQALQNTAVRQGAKLLVVFIDEYITDWRPSLGSANQRNFHQIGIDWVDRNSPYILAHEFVHAFGKSARNAPGRVTWNHNSPCQNAITTVGNRGRNPVDLSNRYLERLEYDEIVQNRGGNVLTARPA